MAVDANPYWTSEPRASTLERLERLAAVVGEQDDPITVRALTYKLHPEAHGDDLNRAYNTTCKDAVRARHLGLVSWSDIKEGRVEDEQPREYRSVDAYLNIRLNVNHLARQFTLDKTPAHERPIEAWFEKATVLDEFESVCSSYGVRCISTRGQMPWAAKKAAADRLDGDALILYFGDNDAKGREICDVIERDLRYLAAENADGNADAATPPTVEWCGVSDEHEARFDLPTGARLDGLEPDDLREIIRGAVTEYIDLDEFDEIAEKERQDKERLRDRLETVFGGETA